MHDERLARPPLLSLVRLRGERERADDEVAVELAGIVVQRSEQLLEKLACLHRCHVFSVLRAFPGVSPREGRPFPRRMSAPVRWIERRRRARKLAKLTRALALLSA